MGWLNSLFGRGSKMSRQQNVQANKEPASPKDKELESADIRELEELEKAICTNHIPVDRKPYTSLLARIGDSKNKDAVPVLQRTAKAAEGFIARYKQAGLHKMPGAWVLEVNAQQIIGKSRAAIERLLVEDQARLQQTIAPKAAELQLRPASSPEAAAPGEHSKVAHWLRELDAEDFRRRIVAARALGELGDPAVLPALERMSRGTDNLWVLFDDGMRARARMMYPSGHIPSNDAGMLRPQLAGNNLKLMDAAKAAIAQIKEKASIITPEEAAMKCSTTPISCGMTQTSKAK